MRDPVVIISSNASSSFSAPSSCACTGDIQSAIAAISGHEDNRRNQFLLMLIILNSLIIPSPNFFIGLAEELSLANDH